MRTRFLVMAAALAALFAVGVGAASAASLAVRPARQLSVSQLHHCAVAMSGGVPVVQTAFASATSVTVRAVPAACVGLKVTINLHSAGGAVIATGSTASALTTQAVTVGTYAPASVSTVIATIGGWVFPTTWAGSTRCVGVDASGTPTGQACTLTLGTVSTWTGGAYKYSQFQFTADTAAPLWKVYFDFSDATKFAGFTPVVVASTQNVALAPGYSCAGLPLFQGIEANPAWGSANGDLTITTDPGYIGGVRLCP